VTNLNNIKAFYLPTDAQ